MPFKTILIVGLASAFLSAQEVRQIDLRGVQQRSNSEAVAAGKYMICGTDDARGAPKAVRVSVESLAPTDIHPRQQISVVLRVENYGRLPVVFPVSPDIAVVQPENGSVRYRAVLPLGAGVPGGVITMGWLELYGSTSQPNTTISLRSREWITVRGNIRVNHWSPAEQRADALSVLQLYKWSPSNSTDLGEQCVKQVRGASITVRFKP